MSNKQYSTVFFGDKATDLASFAQNFKTSSFENSHLVFVDYSQVDSGLAPEGKFVGVIACVDYVENWDNLTGQEYKAQKERVSNC